MVELYVALDEMVGTLAEVAGDAAVVAFTLGGMGSNHSDVASMVLLPELLYRRAFGRSLLTVPAAWTSNPASVPDMAEDAIWARVAKTWYPAPGGSPANRPPAGSLRRFVRRVARPVRSVLRGGSAQARTAAASTGRPPGRGVSWQPAFRYHDHWPSMPAFAIPSYYDGRIRLNLRGRERDGMVDPADYETVLAELEATLLECRNPMTGEPAVAFFERASTRDPLALSGSEVDLLVIWNGVVGALEHPTLGLVGPVPLRRTGGHTGEHGVAYIAAPGVEPGERGVRSAFDVAPTIAALLGAEMPPGTSGTSLL
jgi:hypothetical protein